MMSNTINNTVKTAVIWSLFAILLMVLPVGKAYASCGFNTAGDYLCEGTTRTPNNPGRKATPGYSGTNSQVIDLPPQPPYTPGDLSPGIVTPYIPIDPIFVMPPITSVPGLTLPTIRCENKPGQTVTLPGGGTFKTPGSCPKQDGGYDCQGNAPISDQTKADAYNLIARREGIRDCSYHDGCSASSPCCGKGHLTIGIGHLVKPGDGITSCGQCVSQEQIQAWYQHDSNWAFNAAKKQAAEYGINDSCFTQVLMSVNYQWGDGWTHHKDSPSMRALHQALKNKDYCGAQAVLMNHKYWWNLSCVRPLDLSVAISKVSGGTC